MPSKMTKERTAVSAKLGDKLGPSPIRQAFIWRPGGETLHKVLETELKKIKTSNTETSLQQLRRLRLVCKNRKEKDKTTFTGLATSKSKSPSGTEAVEEKKKK